MKVIINKLDKIEEYILIVTFPLMLIFVFSATFFRYFELGSLTWAEEASRYLMIWAAFAGISLGFKNNAHLGLSFLVDKFSPPIQKLFYIIRAGIITLFGSLLAYHTFILVSNQVSNNQLSPSLGLPIWTVYSSILFGALMIIIRTLIATKIGLQTNDFQKSDEEGSA